MNFLRRLFAVGLALLLGIGLAALSGMSARHFIADVNATVGADSSDSAAQAESLRQAIVLAPANAHYRQQLALVTRPDYAAGLTHITNALARRPTWPYDWLLAAHLLAVNGIFDERMTRALARIQETGAGERSLQFDSAVFLLTYWYHLDEAQRQLALPAVKAVLHRIRDAKRLAVVIENLRRVDLFCRRMVDFVDYGAAWCATFRHREQLHRKAMQQRSAR